jgi:hypothetical protein
MKEATMRVSFTPGQCLSVVGVGLLVVAAYACGDDSSATNATATNGTGGDVSSTSTSSGAGASTGDGGGGSGISSGSGGGNAGGATGSGGSGGDGTGGSGGGPGAGGAGGQGTGGDGGSPPLAAIVVVNEVAPDPESGADWVEFFNAGNLPAILTDWTFTDSDPTHIFIFPPGTTILPGQYLSLEEDAVGSFTFGLGTSGDSILLYDEAGNLVDSTSWVAGEADAPTSWGRFPNGTGAFSTRTTVTRGTENQ